MRSDRQEIACLHFPQINLNLTSQIQPTGLERAESPVTTASPLLPIFLGLHIAHYQGEKGL